MPKITIDNQAYTIEAGQNVLHAALSLGLDLPYFCWHPALDSVGSCRLCAVKQFKDEDDTQGKLVMGCMTPAQDGSRFSISDPEAAGFRSAILEWLMVNHPHDCPICDEGGECHLQDMTVMTGHTYREYRFKKRTYRNQDLGPLINHEMNRCIQCYRCVRYYNDYAGEGDLQAFAAHDHVYFGRHEDGVLQSEFSGNLVEVCPTGVFTDKTLKQHYTRKWDLQTAPSVCTGCSVGCNTLPGERYGTLRRIRNRYNGQVNRYFLCDRGRYGYEYVNSPQRIRRPLRRDPQTDTLQPVEPDAALRRLASILADSRRVIGLGSPRASLESNFALRELVGPDNFFAGISAPEHQRVRQIIDIFQHGPARTPSLHEMQQADAVLVLGEDLTNTAPMMALVVRQASRQQPLAIPRGLDIPDWHDAAAREAMQQQRGPLFIATPAATKLDGIATDTYRAAPDDLARLGFAVAHALDGQAASVPDLPDELVQQAQTIAAALKKANRPLIISGTSLGSVALVQAAANVAWALRRQGRPAELSYALRDCNSMGLGLLGGGTLAEAVEAGADTVLVLENDLSRRANPDAVSRLLASATHVVALDSLASDITRRADVVLPAATFAEGDGTFVNQEGRAQRFYQVFVPEDGHIQSSWRWLGRLIRQRLPSPNGAWRGLDQVAAELAGQMDIFAAIPDIAPPAGFRAVGQKIPRQPHRYSGRTAMHASKSEVNEPQPPPADHDAPLNFSMEGYLGEPPAPLITHYWAPGWNSVQAVNKFQSEVGGPLHGGDPGRRLFEPPAIDNRPYFSQIPAAFQRQTGALLAVPLYHIFGSEPRSLHTPGLAELAPTPYLALNPADAEQQNLSTGDTLALDLDGQPLSLPVKLRPDLPRGLVGVPSGLPGVTGLSLPVWGQVIVPEVTG